jgi:endonuclease YncB( thermonuclease family)
MRSFSFSGFFAAAVLAVSALGGVCPSWAATEVIPITGQMSVIDPMTLQSGDVRIRLWGIALAQTAEAPLELKARDLMEKLTGSGAVTCKPVSGVSPEMLARCTAATREDLGLELVSRGYAVVDRHQPVDGIYTPAYTAAEKSARQNAEGVWRSVDQEKKDDVLPQWLQIILMWGPMAGLLVVAYAMHHRLRRMEILQQDEMEQQRRKESALLRRERHVLVSTLEGELTENKNRIEAFLTIYGDMLRNLKNMEEAPKYQRAGDIIQKHPSLSKSIFEANAGKLSLLDMHLAGQLSKLYASLPPGQEYINIEPSLSLETAQALVEKVLKEAGDMLEPINQALAALTELAAKKPG